MNLKVRFIPEVSREEIYNGLRQMQKEHVAFNILDIKTKYIGAYIDNKLIGVVGFQFIDSNHVRYKVDYLLPEFRGKKIYKALFQYRDEYLRDFPIKIFSAFCTQMSLPTYIKYGFKGVNRNKKEITFVKRLI